MMGHDFPVLAVKASSRTREHAHAQCDGQNKVAIVGLLQLQQVLLGADAPGELGRLLVGFGRQLVHGLCKHSIHTNTQTHKHEIGMVEKQCR